MQPAKFCSECGERLKAARARLIRGRATCDRCAPRFRALRFLKVISLALLIIDEAHHVEDEATHQLGWRLGERELLSRLDRLWSQGPGGSGALSEALGLIATANGPRSERQMSLPNLSQAAKSTCESGQARLSVRLIPSRSRISSRLSSRRSAVISSPARPS